MDEHPVWKSLDVLLDSHKGEDIAMKFVGEKELTPLEFLSACAAQADFVSTWTKRVELLRAVRIAISQDPRRAFGFGESIFRDLVNREPYDQTFAAELVDVFIDILRLVNPKAATESLLKCLYDPVLTRIKDSETAQTLGRRIIDILENEFQTFTVQRILLYSNFREREELDEGSTDSESSLSDWANTSDSTESSLDERDFGCPIESSAAAAWVLAPSFIDPPVLSSFGRYAWAAKHARQLLGLASNTLAAQRGLELFASFGNVTFPTRKVSKDDDGDYRADLYDTVVAALKYVTAIQSLPGRDVVSNFILGIEGYGYRWHVLAKLAQDTMQPPTIRGYALDLIRKDTFRTDQSLMMACALSISLLEKEGYDEEIATACFSVLQSLAVRGKNGNDKCRQVMQKHVSRVCTAVTSVHKQAKELEAEILKEDRFELKLPNPIQARDSKGEDTRRSEAPPGFFSIQANHGRARLIAGTAEMLLELCKGFDPI